MAKFGFFGKRPTQSTSANSGVFSVNDVTELIKKNKWKPQGFDVAYLVIAGAGGGSTSNSSDNRGGGGGGAGGYRNSYASETSGGNSSTETPLFVLPNTSYSVTIGGGGAGGSGNYLRNGSKGSDSSFASITSEGGGGCVVNYTDAKNGGSGAGGMHNTNTGGTGETGQGHAGGNGGGNAGGYTGGSGGGAGALGTGSIYFQGSSVRTRALGLASSITGSSVTRAYGGGQGKGTPSSGSVNTGNGGDGSPNNSTAGTGGSGVVILRYPNKFTATTTGLTTGGEQTDGNDKYLVITAGIGGTVSWSA
jgi:MSHA biogenesis protein MshQ